MKIAISTILFLILFSGCRTNDTEFSTTAASNSLRVSDEDTGFVPAADRSEYLKNAKIFVAHPTWFPSVEELLAGPETKRAPVKINQTNHCHYFQRTNKGTNPKFRCFLADENKNYIDKKGNVIPYSQVDKIRDDKMYDSSGNKLGKVDEVKVKYFPSETARSRVRIYRRNPFGRYLDRYTEVVGTRILWAMGFAADKMWPTSEVKCFNCPIEPFHHPTRSIRDVVTFPDGAIERKYKGKKIESKVTKKGQGWNWKEAKWMSENFWQGTPKQDEFEALLLTVTFLNHVSNRPEQQRLLCKKGSIDELGFCHKTVMMVQDIGSILGHRKIEYINGRRHKSKSKGSVKNWSEHKIWRNETNCTLNMNFYPDHSSDFLEFKISKSGLDFAKKRFNQFTREHIYSLLKYAKLDRADMDLKEKIIAEGNESNLQEIALQTWTDAFMNKLIQITSKECPE